MRGLVVSPMDWPEGQRHLGIQRQRALGTQAFNISLKDIQIRRYTSSLFIIYIALRNKNGHFGIWSSPRAPRGCAAGHSRTPSHPSPAAGPAIDNPISTKTYVTKIRPQTWRLQALIYSSIRQRCIISATQKGFIYSSAAVTVYLGQQNVPRQGLGGRQDVSKCPRPLKPVILGISCKTP